MNYSTIGSPRSSTFSIFNKSLPYRVQDSRSLASVSLKDFSNIKRNTVFSLSEQTVQQILATDPSHDLSRAQTIGAKQTDNQQNLKNLQKISLAISPRKKKGSMYISELWSGKHLKNVIKTSGIGKTAQHVLPNEITTEQTQNLPKLLDPTKVIEHFFAQDSNKSDVKTLNKNYPHSERGNSLPKLIFNKEIAGETTQKQLKIRKSLAKKKAEVLEEDNTINDLITKIQGPKFSNKMRISKIFCETNMKKNSIFSSGQETSSILLTFRSIESVSPLTDQASNKKSINSPKDTSSLSSVR